NTLHQPASVLRMEGPSIHAEMLWPLLLMAVGFTFYYVTLLLVRMKSELLAARTRALRLTALGAGRGEGRRGEGARAGRPAAASS
ncbi:MAG: hypothetical protein OEM93_13955, partial [Rhodospirillales bacterium]|nr:hypothetical protein [Rhodospirillales bacterium]